MTKKGKAKNGNPITEDYNLKDIQKSMKLVEVYSPNLLSLNFHLNFLKKKKRIYYDLLHI